MNNKTIAGKNENASMPQMVQQVTLMLRESYSNLLRHHTGGKHISRVDYTKALEAPVKIAVTHYFTDTEFNRTIWLQVMAKQGEYINADDFTEVIKAIIFAGHGDRISYYLTPLLRNKPFQEYKKEFPGLEPKVFCKDAARYVQGFMDTVRTSSAKKELPLKQEVDARKFENSLRNAMVEFRKLFGTAEEAFYYVDPLK